MTIAEKAGAWRTMWASGLLGRFVLLCTGVWLHAADSLVTATIVPAVVDDIGGVAYVAWLVSFYEIGAIVAGAATAMLSQRIGVRHVLIAAALTYGGGCAIAAIAPDMTYCWRRGSCKELAAACWSRSAMLRSSNFSPRISGAACSASSRRFGQ